MKEARGDGPPVCRPPWWGQGRKRRGSGKRTDRRAAAEGTQSLAERLERFKADGPYPVPDQHEEV